MRDRFKKLFKDLWFDDWDKVPYFERVFALFVLSFIAVLFSALVIVLVMLSISVLVFHPFILLLILGLVSIPFLMAKFI